jgi:hypothetical protein
VKSPLVCPRCNKWEERCRCPSPRPLTWTTLRFEGFRLKHPDPDLNDHDFAVALMRDIYHGSVYGQRSDGQWYQCPIEIDLDAYKGLPINKLIEAVGSATREALDKLNGYLQDYTPKKE